MRETWRWFGPQDPVSLADARQAGAVGIVTALHHLPVGQEWNLTEIQRRQQKVRAESFEWEVVESLPVSEEIKTQKGLWREHLSAWRESLKNIAAAGIEVICYNFMPILDWTRTELRWTLSNGGRAMLFDLADFALFDIHILRRPGAQEEYAAEIVEEAKERLDRSDEEYRKRLTTKILAGLPGAAESWSLADVRQRLTHYEYIGADQLRKHFVDFLSEVIPTAERLGLRLCCHPDDPPWPLLGLPRIMSRESDYKTILDSVDSPSNGMTFCAGSLGARADNDLAGMVKRLGDRVHFIHLRNVRRLSENVPCTFYEDTHLGGQVDMVGVVEAFLREEKRRKIEGRKDATIPMRCDHGQELQGDLQRDAQPGYPATGRLRGLAELRGVASALERAVL